MFKRRGTRPANSLGGLRRVVVVLSLISVVMLVGQMMSVQHPVQPRAWTLGAIAGLALVFLVTYQRRQTGWYDAPLLLLLIAVAGRGLPDPMGTTGICVTVVFTQSLYGSNRAAAMRAVASIGALMLVVSTTPIDSSGLITWNSPVVIGVAVEIVLMTATVRGIYLALVQQGLAREREAVLARAGGQMLGVTDAAVVARLGEEAAAELIRLSPGVRLDGDELLPAGRKPVPPHIRIIFDNLRNQVALAISSCAVQAELDHRAHHDALTGLAARSLFERELDEVLQAAQEFPVVLMIDLDDFKRVNDIHGHGAGDELLIAVAKRLTAATQEQDVVARFGGDEFAILLRGHGATGRAAKVAADVCRRVVAPVRLKAATVTVGASIGYAVAEPGLPRPELMQCADIAMYSAKAQGKNRVVPFSTERHGDIARNRVLEQSVGHAVERNEVELRFQPYGEYGSDAPAGVRVLPYWRHSSLGMLPPDELTVPAERLGLAASIDGHVLRAACRLVAGLDATAPPVTVRVSAVSLAQPGFVAAVKDALGQAHAPAERLILEIAAGTDLEDPSVRDTVRALAALGLGVALDDFGSRPFSLDIVMELGVTQVTVAEPAEGQQRTTELALAVAGLLGARAVVRPAAPSQGPHLPDGLQAMPEDALRAWLAARTTLATA